MPEVSSVYMRSDNAGCYHCAFTLLSVYHVASEQAIELTTLDIPRKVCMYGELMELTLANF